MSYGYWNLTGLLNQKFWTDLTFRHESASWSNFAMTTLKTLNTEIVTNLDFCWLLIALSDARFHSYEFSKTGHGAERFWIDWT
jgi:hypothetical protein